MDPLLRQFYHQYLQQVTNLTYPAPQLLAHSDVQRQLYRYFFDAGHDAHLPPPDFQRRVLKRLLGDIVREACDEDDEVSDDLMDHMGRLSSLPNRSDPETAQTPRVLSYHLPTLPRLQGQAGFDDTLRDGEGAARRILVREAPQLLAAGSNVGFRTWEACLRLGYYLCTSKIRDSLKGANVLELGAGTGLLSLICAMELGAGRVVATDGLSHVLDGVVGNIALNQEAAEAEAREVRLPTARLLDWTDAPRGDQMGELFGWEGPGQMQLDYVLGADIMYHPDLHAPLVTLIAELKRHYPKCRILISVPVRNEETFRMWKQTCGEHGLEVRQIDELGDGWQCPPYRQQTGLFHEQVFPIVIMDIENRRNV